VPGRQEETTQRVAYGPGLRRTAQIAAAIGVIAAAVELAVGPHRITSVVFLIVGTTIGVLVGRSLARTLADWAADAPVVSEDERASIVAGQRTPYAVVGLVVLGVIAVAVPIGYDIPTPLPGALMALAVQTWLQARAIDDVEARRRGSVLRPRRRLSFDGEDLRLLPHPAGDG
jgi:hypothetical protein